MFNFVINQDRNYTLFGILPLIMPAALIIVMSIASNAPNKSLDDLRYDVLWVNRDKGNFGRALEQKLKESKHFNLIELDSAKQFDSEGLMHLLKKGTYSYLILVPETATRSAYNTSNELVNTLSRHQGKPAGLPSQKRLNEVRLSLLTDPDIKPVEITPVLLILNQLSAQVKLDFMMPRISQLGGQDSLTKAGISLEQFLSPLSVIQSEQMDNYHFETKASPVYPYVITWAIFGMFMIVVPISANMIRERDERSSLRVKLIPHSLFPVAIGQVLFYLLVCVGQFICMMLVGVYALPYFGLPAMSLDSQYGALAVMILALAIAAVGYGFFIGSVFRTVNQAQPFGAISIVLFAALGGLWVPLKLFPPLMKQLAHLSPINWTLEGFNQLVIREAGFAGMAPYAALLIVFGIGLPIIGLFVSKRTSY